MLHTVQTTVQLNRTYYCTSMKICRITMFQDNLSTDDSNSSRLFNICISLYFSSDVICHFNF